MRRTTLIASLAALALLAACGGGSSKKEPTPARTTSATTAQSTPGGQATGGKDETQFAQSMLLQLADFPSGWILVNSAQVNEDSPLDTLCGTSIEDGKTGRAVTGDFAADNSGPTISETVITFPDASTGQDALDKVPDRIDCAIKAINDGKLDSGGVTFSKAESREANVSAPGDKHYAYQIRMDANDSSVTGGPQTVYFLLVYALDGRVGYSLTGTSYDAPYDTGLMTATAKSAAAKLKQQP
jgi:hypothetical protein